MSVIFFPSTVFVYSAIFFCPNTLNSSSCIHAWMSFSGQKIVTIVLNVVCFLMMTDIIIVVIEKKKEKV